MFNAMQCMSKYLVKKKTHGSKRVWGYLRDVEWAGRLSCTLPNSVDMAAENIGYASVTS